MRRPKLLSLALASSLAVNLLAVLALATGLFGQAEIPGAEAARELAPVGAKAFARVTAGNGALDFFDETRSRNVRNVQHPATGTYCLNLDVPVKNVVASLKPAGNIPFFITAGLIGPDGKPPGCPDSYDVFVLTGTETGPAKADFYVVMH